jgi:DNA-binding beta-propeller fold protein YncE
VPIIGKVDAYQMFMVDVLPFIELEETVELPTCDPVEAAFDSTTTSCYFGPVPFGPNHQVMGVNSALNPVTGFPNMMATGSIGLCRGTREIYVATDQGKDWTDDITVLDIDMKSLDYTLDIPSLFGNYGTKPVDLIVNQNVQEVWASLYSENQAAVFPAGITAPDIARVDVGTGPVTMAIDQSAYKVFVACEGNDTVAIINGWSRTVENTISLHHELQSPSPDFPAAVGMAYVPSLDRLYVATLDAGVLDYYNVAGASYEGSVALSDGTYAVVGLIYEPTTGFLYATGQTASPLEHGLVWVVDPDTNQVMEDIETSSVNPGFPAVDPDNKRLFVGDPIGLVDIYQITS